MRRERLPIDALPTWCKLNNISLLDVAVRDLGSQGHGILTQRVLASTEDSFDLPALLIVPNELILCKETIDEHAKVDQHFRELLNVAGGKSLRIDAMLFLLMQVTITSTEHGQVVGVSNPWTEYVKMLPDFVSLPTLWTEEECVMLQGTSLETATNAKSASLLREYEAIRNATTELTWCQQCWWENEMFQLGDWKLIDAWFRSRSLEHPTAGEAMIPSLDMVNHSSNPNSYYEPGASNTVNLLLKPGSKLVSGTEVTISYGESKSAAEMLFNYGFIDGASTKKSLVLPLEPDPSDPLGKAKIIAFPGSKTVQLSIGGDDAQWESPFLHFLCVNQEDGLDFKILQENDGSTSLRAFWQGSDVTFATATFESLIGSHGHDLRAVFKLRAAAILEELLQGQLARLYIAEEKISDLAEIVDLAIDRQEIAIMLREDERAILVEVLKKIRLQKAELLENEDVRRYLGLSYDLESATCIQDDFPSNEDDL